MLVVALIAATGCGADRPSNFLVIVADDLGWMDAGFQNPSSFYDTPNLDRLAASGVVFTDAYANAPVSSPTRASLLTGQHPVRLEMTDFIGARTAALVLTRPRYPHPLLPAHHLKSLSAQHQTVAERLRKAGYATMFAGKWNVGPEGNWPEDRGFDINVGGWTAGAPHTGRNYFSPYDNPRMRNGPPGEHLPHRLASETARFIQQKRDQPFLAWLSFYSVHTPLMAPDTLVTRYMARPAPPDSFSSERARRVRLSQNHPVYAAMVSAMDRAVGLVLDSLESSGQADNTIVIFVSDNGGLSTSEGHPTSNHPLRAGKGWLYEGGIRVPLIVRIPEIDTPGLRTATPVTTADLTPTIESLAGLAPRPEAAGFSLVPLLRGQQVRDRVLWWHYPHYSHQGGPPASAIRSGNLKYLEFYETGERELYDLRTDPGESQNLVGARPEEAKLLRAKLFELLEAASARYPFVHPDRGGSLDPRHPRLEDYGASGDPRSIPLPPEN